MLLLAAVWDFCAIFSPLIILCWYPRLKMVNWLGSPYVVAPASIGVSVFAFLFFGGDSLYGLLVSDHFLIGGIMLLGSCLLFQKTYSRTVSFLMAVLVILASDQLWQVPLDIINWSVSYRAAEVGLSTVSFSFMSLPVLLYIVTWEDHRIRLSWRWLLIGILVTAVEVPFLKPGDATVWFSPLVMAVWVCFLVSGVLLSKVKAT